MNRQLMLERRILRLEKLIAERSAKPNLFSKNLDDIKLAIENGESIKSTNASGKTPLAFAVSSSVDNPEIVKYLLSKGANPNEILNKAPLIFTAIKNNKEGTVLALLENRKTNKAARVDGPRGDMSGSRNIISYACEYHKCHNILDRLILDGLADKFESGEMYWTINIVCEEYLSYDLPEDVYIKCINKLVGRGVKNGIPAGVIIDKHKPSAELRIHGTHHLLDLAMDNGYWPCYFDSSINGKNKLVLYDALVKSIENKMYLEEDIGDVIDVGTKICRATKKPIDILENVITSEYLLSQDPWDVYSAIRDSLYSPIIIGKIMQLRSSFELDQESCNALIEDVVNNKVKDDTSKKYVYRLLNTYKDNFMPGHEVIEAICKKKHQKMFEFLVDLGFAKSFTTSDAKLPKSFKEYLKEYSSEDTDDDDYDDWEKFSNSQELIKIRKAIKRSVIEDTWDTKLDAAVNKYPELLNDPELLKLIDQNISNSFTARDLNKRIKELANKSTDLYDM